MNKEAASRSPLGWFRNLLNGGVEHSHRRQFDLSCVKHDPLATQLKPEQLRMEPNVPLSEAQAGDVFVIHEKEPHLAVATGQIIGSRHIFYRMYPAAERTAYLDQSSLAEGTRIAQQTAIHIPELELQNPINEPAAGEYLVALPSSDELTKFRFRFTETYVDIFHRGSSAVGIESLDEIQFNARTGELPFEYLYVTKKGVPIFLSDFHQKLATHIAYLVATELLPNQRPLVTWIDKHPDDVFNRNGLHKLPKKQFSLKGVNSCVDKIDCGQAASILMHTGLAEVRGMAGLSALGPPRNSLAYSALEYQQPFARPPHTQPQVLSFDLDQIPAFCNQEYNKYVGDFVGLDGATTKNYFDWLARAGMNATNFDAVCAYTSPGYVEPAIALEGFKYLVSLFE